MATHHRVLFDERRGEDWIRVVDLFPEQHRYLHFEHSIQGVMSLVDHCAPVLEYVGVLCTGARLLKPEPSRVLIGGLGSCTTLHAFNAYWKHRACIRSIESSPLVLELARRFFRLDQRDDVILGDFRSTLEDEIDRPQDLIVIDCYSSQFVPPHLLTLEFMDLLYQSLDADGIAVFNIWSPGCNRICGAQIRTLLEVFEEVAIAACREDDNFIVFASRRRRPDWPVKIHFKGLVYRLDVLSLRFRGYWPDYMKDAGLIGDRNMLDFLRELMLQHGRT